MIMKQTHLLFLFLIFFLFSCKETPDIKPLVNTYIEKVSVNDREITQNGTIHNVNTDSVVVRIWFSSKIEKEKYDPLKIFVSNGVDADISVLNDTLSRVFSFRINKKLDKFTQIIKVSEEGCIKSKEKKTKTYKSIHSTTPNPLKGALTLCK